MYFGVTRSSIKERPYVKFLLYFVQWSCCFPLQSVLTVSLFSARLCKRPLQQWYFDKQFALSSLPAGKVLPYNWFPILTWKRVKILTISVWKCFLFLCDGKINVLGSGNRHGFQRQPDGTPPPETPRRTSLPPGWKHLQPSLPTQGRVGLVVHADSFEV